MINSIISYPDRGAWGDAKWRGNCSGHVYKDLFQQLRPQTFVDPMVGSGTSVEVAQELGIKAWGLDLHSGFNAVTDSILEAVGGHEVDLCVSHPPYGAMILYSGNVWGNKPNQHDLSRCSNNDEFHEKMQLVLLNQRDATKAGKFYGTIIGDYRKNGTYTSYQAEMIARMPADELAAVIIKAQHNCWSDQQSYNLALPRIMHEYILLWKKKDAPILLLLSNVAKQQYGRVTGTWRNIVSVVLQRLGGKAQLSAIYDEVAKEAPQRLTENTNWQAKIRQVLNTSKSLFSSHERGIWQFA